MGFARPQTTVHSKQLIFLPFLALFVIECLCKILANFLSEVTSKQTRPVKYQIYCHRKRIHRQFMTLKKRNTLQHANQSGSSTEMYHIYMILNGRNNEVCPFIHVFYMFITEEEEDASPPGINQNYQESQLPLTNISVALFLRIAITGKKKQHFPFALVIL